MGRIFWIGGLGLSVLVFLGLGLGGIAYVVWHREFGLQPMLGAVWCLSLALLSYQLLVKRIINLPDIDPSVAPKPEDFYDDEKGY